MSKIYCKVVILIQMIKKNQFLPLLCLHFLFTKIKDLKKMRFLAIIFTLFKFIMMKDILITFIHPAIFICTLKGGGKEDGEVKLTLNTLNHLQYAKKSWWHILHYVTASAEFNIDFAFRYFLKHYDPVATHFPPLKR